jgi:hypothetical protein
MAALIERVCLPAFSSAELMDLADGAPVSVGGERLAFSTDTFVVKPILFPGGDIGSLAVHGTVNDLAMCGAVPLFFSAACALEEGVPLADLERVVASMARASVAVGTPIVTGDTKVVDKGKGDGIFINTPGIGRIREGVAVGPGRAQPGDAVLVSGPVGDHGIAVMAARADLAFDTMLLSDSAPFIGLVSDLLDAVPGTHVPRDHECELILEMVSCGAEPGEVTSVRTALRVAAIDFNHVHPLSGGLERWRQAGFPGGAPRTCFVNQRQTHPEELTTMMPTHRIAILTPLAVGVSAIVCTIIVHALALSATVNVVRRERRLGRAGAGFWIDVAIVAVAILFAVVAHLVEIALWALLFRICGEFRDFGTAFDHSAVNYTTLGYGDVIMTLSWRLLGPLEAANGLLMFGVSTAMIFSVIQLLIQARFRDLRD